MPVYLPPGPQGAENLAYARLMGRDPLLLFTRMQERYGSVSAVRLGPQLLCLVTEPALIHRILVHDNASFKKGKFLELAKDLLGDGLLTSEGELHQRQRQLIQPMFHRQMIRAYAGIMADWGERFAARWHDGARLDLAHEMMKLTLAIVGEALFGADVEQDASDVGEAMETVLDITVVGQPLTLMTRNLPTPKRRRFLHAKGLLDATIQAIIDKQRQGGDPDGRRNLIGLLLEAKDEAGQGMSDQLIRDEALTLFLAGHETTANALAWSWHLLAQSPRVEARLHAELAELLGGRTPTIDDLPKLVYTRQVLTEAMRLYPPAWTLGRRALRDYELGRFRIPKGTILVLSQFLVHRSPRYFSDPLSFRPERWTPEFKAGLPKFAYFPFGGGPRNCIGEAFAWMEGTLLLATLGQRWRFASAPGSRVEPQPMVTLRPRNGLMMDLRRR